MQFGRFWAASGAQRQGGDSALPLAKASGLGFGGSMHGVSRCVGHLAAKRVRGACAPDFGPLRGEHLQYSKFGKTSKLASLRHRRFLIQISACFKPSAPIGAQGTAHTLRCEYRFGVLAG